MKQRQKTHRNLLPIIGASLSSAFLLINALPANANTLGTLSIPSSDLPASAAGDINAAILNSTTRLDMVASRTITLSAGDTLARLLVREGVAKDQRDAALRALADTFDVSKLKAGDQIELSVRGTDPTKRQLVSLRLHAGKTEAVTVASSDDGIFRLQGKAPVVAKAEAATILPVGVTTLELGTPVQNARMTSPWGWRVHPVLGVRKFHKGVDFAAPKGTPVYAAESGVVQDLGWRGNYGRYLKISHNEHLATAYAHLAKFAPGLHAGSHVRKGQVIAYIGASGLATGNHLYYEVLVDNKQVDPLQDVMVQVSLDGSSQIKLEPYATRVSQNTPHN